MLIGRASLFQLFCVSVGVVTQNNNADVIRKRHDILFVDDDNGSLIQVRLLTTPPFLKTNFQASKQDRQVRATYGVRHDESAVTYERT